MSKTDRPLGSVRNVLVFVAMIGGSACHTSHSEIAEYRGPILLGSSWTLTEFQSGANEEQSFSMAPNKINLHFEASGAAQFKLDCNRGNSTWAADPERAEKGSLRFGEVAMTRALCPGKNSGEKVARDMPFVSSYKISDSHLIMLIDGRTDSYVWEIVD